MGSMRIGHLLCASAAWATLLVACGGGEAAPATSVPSEPPTTTLATEPAPTTEPKPKPKVKLEDGRHFGYIAAAHLTSEPRQLRFDLAYFLTGEEANAAAEERGFETPVPNDYFVVNDNPRLRRLPVAADVAIDLVDWKDCCDKRFAGDPARFEAAFATAYKSPPSRRYHGRFSAYWLTLEGGAVVAIEEQYLP
jgi:hypothetical protein